MSLKVCFFTSLLDDCRRTNCNFLCGKDTRSVPEPSGALSVAGMKKYIQENNLLGKGRRFVSVVSGANLNFSRLRFIAERADVGEGKEAMLRVIIPERPGAYVASCSTPVTVSDFTCAVQVPRTAFYHPPSRRDGVRVPLRLLQICLYLPLLLPHVPRPTETYRYLNQWCFNTITYTSSSSSRRTRRSSSDAETKGDASA